MKHLLLFATLALPALAFAQGALTPPGAPAPTMKSLDQIEARTPIGAVGGSTATIAITQPGSYVLLGNVTVTGGNAITISADNVTLDLNGFTLSSTAKPTSGAGIRTFGTCRGIAIRNGHISGSILVDESNGSMIGGGFERGIFSGDFLINSLVTDLTIDGVSNDGIYLDASSAIDRCTVINCGGTGIRGQVVSNCTATACGTTGILATTISNSQGFAVKTSGIEATTATNCVGAITGLTSGVGLKAGSAANCTGTGTNGTGLLAGTATDCTGTSNSGFGLQADTATGCHGATLGGQRGLYIIGTATNCRGKNSAANGVALSAHIAIGCTAESGSILVNYRYNMP